MPHPTIPLFTAFHSQETHTHWNKLQVGQFVHLFEHRFVSPRRINGQMLSSCAVQCRSCTSAAKERCSMNANLPDLNTAQWCRSNSHPDAKLLAAEGAQTKKETLGPQVCVMRFFFLFFPPTHPTMFPQSTRVPLTVTAACLTALDAVWRISAAVPGFSRFLVNLRVDSAAMSSSERSRSPIQPWGVCAAVSQTHLPPPPARLSC